MNQLTIFHGKDDNFLSYKEQLFLVAKDIHVACSYGQGMLAFLLPATEFLTLPFQADLSAPVHFEPCAPPGARPLPNTDNYLANFMFWKSNADPFETQQISLSKFRTLFLNSLSDSVKLRIGTPTHGIDRLPIRQIYSLLATHFAPHGDDVFSVGPALQPHRCYTESYIVDKLSWHPTTAPTCRVTRH